MAIQSRNKRLLVLSFTDHARDPRVSRQIDILRNLVTVISVGQRTNGCTNADESVELNYRRPKFWEKVILGSSLLCGFNEFAYWSHPNVIETLKDSARLRFDGILANDLDTLPLALRIAQGKPVIFDAHEYAPREFEQSLQFRILWMRYNHYLCKKYIPQASAMMTVSDGIADEYQAYRGTRPTVVWNAPEYLDKLGPNPTSQTIRLVHHGGASRDRQIEKMIEMMSYLDQRFTLDLILVGTDSRYVAELQSMAKNDPRISFPPPVPMREIPSHLNQYDVGLAYFEPLTFNLLHVLPNKFFEFIQARIGVAIGPSPEMAGLVSQHQLGVVADDFTPQALARSLNQLSAEDIDQFKDNAHRSARALSAERTRDQLLEMVNRVFATEDAKSTAE